MLKVCPVLSFTSDVQSVLRWFDWTHALTVIPMGGARFERVAWPRRGAAAAQDAWLTAALDYVRLVRNAILREDVARASKTTPREGARRGR